MKKKPCVVLQEDLHKARSNYLKVSGWILVKEGLAESNLLDDEEYWKSPHDGRNYNECFAVTVQTRMEENIARQKAHDERSSSKKSKMKFLFHVAVGAGGFGHEKNEKFLIRANKPYEDVMRAYEVATKKIGFDFVKTIAREYREKKITKKQYDALVAGGVKFDEDWNWDMPDDDGNVVDYVDLEPWSYVETWIDIVESGDKELVIEADNEIGLVNIGGYGLFD